MSLFYGHDTQTDINVNIQGSVDKTHLSNNYYTKTQVDNKFNDHYYNKNQTDGKYALISNLSKYYTKTQADNKYVLVSRLANYYTKNETNGKYALSSNLSKYYTKLESDNKFNDYYTKTQADGKYVLTSNLTNYYTKTEIDDIVNSKIIYYSNQLTYNTNVNSQQNIIRIYFNNITFVEFTLLLINPSDNSKTIKFDIMVDKINKKFIIKPTNNNEKKIASVILDLYRTYCVDDNFNYIEIIVEPKKTSASLGWNEWARKWLNTFGGLTKMQVYSDHKSTLSMIYNGYSTSFGATIEDNILATEKFVNDEIEKLKKFIKDNYQAKN